MAQLEVRELLRRCYQGAVYLGRPQEVAAGPGTAAEVLSRLPGGGAAQASLLHCGCHANVAASMAASHLVLANGERLPIAKILAQAQQREHGGATAPGFLAVLSACMSDLARSDHDEALTLASALLAAGASGVVGARWPVEDRVAAPLMVMVHHFLNHHHSEPAAALRAAQLWMLDPSRSVLGNLPDALASASRRSRLAATHAWAAFTYQGV
jgi:CHAT domain-containing protein